MEYRRTGETPVEIAFNEICWPEGFSFKGSRSPRSQTGNPSQSILETGKGRERKGNPNNSPLDSSATSEPLPICDSETLKDCASSLLHNNSDELGSIRANEGIVPEGKETRRQRTAGEILARKEEIRLAREEFQRENPRRARLYQEFMERRWEAKPQERNQVIVEAVPFLYRAIAEADIAPILMQFHRLNHPMFRATPEEHRYETEKMLEGVRRSYVEAMPEDVRKLYDDLDDREQTAFRICRDLSLLGEDPEERTFFMSGDQLGLRMNLASTQAYRILLNFDRIGLLERIVRGTRHSKGERGVATTYKWLLDY